MSWVFRGRWLVGWILVALVSVTFIRLGIWQLDRMEWRRDLNATIEWRRSQPPRDIWEYAQDRPAGAMHYLPVTATGTYDTRNEVILYGRARNGQAGNHLLTPLGLDVPADSDSDGEVVFVDRGWVPLSMNEPGALDEQTPDGTVAIEGIILPPESHADRPPADVVKDVSDRQLDARVEGGAADFYILLRAQDPPQEGPFPEPVPEPALSSGPHLSYAIQWFIFATIAIVGWALLLRRESRDRSRAGSGRGKGAPEDAPPDRPSLMPADDARSNTG